MAPATSVLIVDDNTQLRQLVRITLEQMGCEVHVAGDGVVAGALLQVRAFDVLITDLDMPRLSGLELLVDLRRLQPDARAVLMSGEWQVGRTDVRELAEQLGDVQFLSKPFPLHALRQAVAPGRTTN